MSYFSTALSRLIERHDWTQQQAAKLFCIGTSTIAQYTTARRCPTSEQLALMLRPLDHEDRVSLMLAVLKDSIPGEEFSDLVMLEPCGEGSRLRDEAVTQYLKSPLPAKVRKAMEIIEGEATTDAELQAMLITFADFLQSAKKKK